jgi:hypothetical protein
MNLEGWNPWLTGSKVSHSSRLFKPEKGLNLALKGLREKLWSHWRTSNARAQGYTWDNTEESCLARHQSLESGIAFADVSRKQVAAETAVAAAKTACITPCTGKEQSP